MAAAGVRHIITTPHLAASELTEPDGAQGYLDEVGTAFSHLVTRVAEELPGLDLRRGFEIMLDVPDPDFSDVRLRLGGTRFVLVEWSWFGVPPDSEAILRRIRDSGWIPVVAHPERARGLDDALETPRRWRAAGAYLQVNHGSFTGRYGDRARERALRLVQAGEADYLSSDHHPGPGSTLFVDACRKVFRALGAEEAFQVLAGENPRRLMEDREPAPVPRVQIPREIPE
jgi:protein-tyrosine phosphatase